MIRYLKINFKTSKNELNRLFECNRISAEIWNQCLKISKEYFLDNDKKWISKTLLQRLMSKCTIGKQTMEEI